MTSTYRVQLHKGFDFKNLKGILEYLHELGISTLYASPVTRAIKGSQHGYDVTDPGVVSPEIGAEQEMEEISRLLKKYEMTWVQDIVPNHMAFDVFNPWIRDVLEEGQSEVGQVGAEGQHLVLQTLPGRLSPHRLAVADRHRVRVAVAADAAQRAEVVVEGSVLLHQDDDVLDVLDRPRAVVALDRGGPGDARREHRGGGGTQADLQEAAAAQVRHGAQSGRAG